MPPTLGVLHPGEMGATVAACAMSAGSRVLWASDGRSQESRARARATALVDAESLGSLCQESDVILSVCPPASAEALAREVMDADFRGLYVDANAINPESARRIGALVENQGARFADAGIIGPPARQPGSTRIAVCGSHGQEVASLFASSHLEPMLVEGGAGAASALKMAYAAYTKGSAALLVAVRALARQSGVEQALLTEWSRSQPHLEGLSTAMARNIGPKAWRFVGEMHEVANTFEQADLPGNFHRGAAELYAALSGLKGTRNPGIDEVLETIAASTRAAQAKTQDRE